MQPLFYVALLLLRCLLSVSAELHCSKTQYPWPVHAARLCCDKCPAGKRMERRSHVSCQIECKDCTEHQFMDSDNVEMSCKFCKNCKKANMVYVSHCNTTHDAVCRCIAGYTCRDGPCTQCVPVTTPTSSTSTTTTYTNSAWYLVIIGLLCVGIALIVLTKIKPFLRWMMTKEGAAAPSSEDDDMCKPVQEVCGECDQPIDVCTKARQLLSQHLDQ